MVKIAPMGGYYPGWTFSNLPYNILFYIGDIQLTPCRDSLNDSERVGK